MWVTNVIILTRCLNPSYAEICAKSKKKIFTSEIPSFPSSMPQYGKISFFYYVNVRYHFFRKIFKTTNGSLKCASGSLSDPRVSGSPSLRRGMQRSIAKIFLLIVSSGEARNFKRGAHELQKYLVYFSHFDICSFLIKRQERGHGTMSL